jgi:hypothetical protein
MWQTLVNMKQDTFIGKPSNTSAKISYLNQCQTIKRLIISISWRVSTYTKFSILLKHMQHLQLYWKIINWSMNM